MSRRTVLEGGAGLLGLLALGLASAGTATGRPPSEPTAGPATAESWTRLYQGTATVTITYLTGLDREATGELPVDVRFAPPETLVTGGRRSSSGSTRGNRCAGTSSSRRTPTPTRRRRRSSRGRCG